MNELDQRFMRLALDLARTARLAGEVPVGAVVVVDGEPVGQGHNGSIARTDPTAHAEILAIRDAAARIGNYRLVGAALYCTVEPCLMCLGAALHARVGRLVFGAAETRVGATTRLDTLRGLGAHINHRFETVGGVLAPEASELLRDFFRERRAELHTAKFRRQTERYRSGHNGGASKALSLREEARGFESHPLRHTGSREQRRNG